MGSAPPPPLSPCLDAVWTKKFRLNKIDEQNKLKSSWQSHSFFYYIYSFFFCPDVGGGGWRVLSPSPSPAHSSFTCFMRVMENPKKYITSWQSYFRRSRCKLWATWNRGRGVLSYDSPLFNGFGFDCLRRDIVWYQCKVGGPNVESCVQSAASTSNPCSVPTFTFAGGQQICNPRGSKETP